MKKQMVQQVIFLLSTLLITCGVFFLPTPSQGNGDIKTFSVNDWKKTNFVQQSPEKFTAIIHQTFNIAFTEMDKKYIQPVRFITPISVAVKALTGIDKNILVNISDSKITIIIDNKTSKTFTFLLTDKPSIWAKHLSDIIAYLRTISLPISKLSAEDIYKIVFSSMLAQMDPYSQYLTKQEANQRKNKHHGTLDMNGNITSENNTHIQILDNDIVIITVNSFDSNTSEIIENILNNITINPIGIIFDLSNSNGGILRQAYAAADIFINSGILFKVKGRIQSANKTYKASETMLYKEPIAVIINNKTKSSSEAFALAFKSSNRACIIGNQSFGKGLVQTPILLPDRSEIMLSWAEIYDSNDTALNKHGITPDITVSAKTDKEFHQISIETAIKYILTSQIKHVQTYYR